MKLNQKRKSDIFEEIENNQNNKLTRLSTVLALVLTVGVFLLIIYGLYKMNIIEIPPAVRDMFKRSEVSEYTVKNYDDKNLLEFIAGKSDNVNDDVIYVNITEQDFTQWIAKAPFVSEYSMTQKIDYYSADHKRIIFKNKVWVKGDKYLVEVYDETDSMIKSVMCDGSQVYVKDHLTYDETHIKTYPMSDQFTLENQVGLIDIKTLFTDDIVDMSIELVRENTSNMFLITYGHADIPELTETIKVSFDNGIVNMAETHYNGILIYKMYTESKINVGSINEKLFEITY